MPRVRRDFSVGHHAVAHEARGPVIEHVELALVKDYVSFATAPAPFKEYSTPALAATNIAPAPLVEQMALLAGTNAARGSIEYVAYIALLEYVAPALGVNHEKAAPCDSSSSWCHRPWSVSESAHILEENPWVTWDTHA